MDLYILGPDIELQGIIDGYSSLRWRRRFFEPGEFELHCPATAETLTLLRPENIIHRLDRQEAAIIEGVDIKSTDTGDEIGNIDSELKELLETLLKLMKENAVQSAASKRLAP